MHNSVECQIKASFTYKLYQIVQTVFNLKKLLTFHQIILQFAKDLINIQKENLRKNVVLIFLHQEWGIKVRRNIPKDTFTILDRLYKDHQYQAIISYCN